MSRKLLTIVGVSAKQYCHPSLGSGPLLPFIQQSRLLNTHALSPTVTLISNGRTKHLPNRPDLTKYSSEGRPLSILLCWLMAKNNAVKKYAQFYLDNGFDVLTVRITPTQLLLPTRVEPIVRNEILPTLLTSDHEKRLIHGFSVGGYVFARMLKYMQEHPEGDQLLNSFKAQIWDSVVDVNGVSIGVSKSVFGDNSAMQQALHNYIEFHMRVFYNIATKYYQDAHHYFYNRPLNAPALFFNSEADQISTPDVIQAVQNVWKEKGITCDNLKWKDTAHVGHMRAYPDEYKTTLRNFLTRHGIHKPHSRRAPAVEERDHRDMGISHGIPNVVYSKVA